MKGKVLSVKSVIRKSRLKITGKTQTGEEGIIEAILPAREMAALLPRSILVGDAKKVSPQLLETIQAIASRFIAGREVRLWQYAQVYYFSFIPWRDVVFEELLLE